MKNTKRDGVFYVGQKAFIEKGREVLILNDPINGLDFPGGKIQEGERDFIKALKREVKEETNLEIEVGKPFTVWFHQIMNKKHRNYGKKVYLVGFVCKYVSGNIKLSKEHNDYKWINKDNYKQFDDNSRYFEALRYYFENVYDKNLKKIK